LEVALPYELKTNRVSAVHEKLKGQGTRKDK